MKMSKLFVQTLREFPSDAEVISHKMLARAGYIRKLTSGVYNFLPLMWRVLKKVENIIRDEMDRRVILLSVTPQGKKVLKAHDKFHEDILGLVLDNIQLQQAVKVMTQFANVLEMYYDPSIIETQENKTKKGR